MTFPEFQAPHLIQQRFEKSNGGLPECFYVFSNKEGTAATLQAAHTGFKLAEIKIAKDGNTKRATITDLSLNQPASNTFNYYTSSIGSQVIESSSKEIFEDLAKRCFPNVRMFSCIVR
jgi:hypothetical protein